MIPAKLSLCLALLAQKRRPAYTAINPPLQGHKRGIDVDRIESVLPLFAPLPGPVVEHLLLGKRRSHPKVRPPHLASEFERATGYSQAEWDRLLKLVRTARQNVYMRMDLVVRRNALTTAWLLQALTDASPRKKENEELDEQPVELNQSTLKLWKDHNLISYIARNRPDPQAAAALLITRLTDKRWRNWLPSSLSQDEPHAWCWQQDAPELSPVPCPIPFPVHLPASSLLTSPWRGLAWSPDWTPINSASVARWAGALVPDDLRRWDPPVAALLLEAPQTTILHQRLTEVALIRQALRQLRGQQQL